MGISYSFINGRMSGRDHDLDPSEPQDILRSSSATEEPDLPSIVAYLIRSGQIRFISQDTGNSDDSDASSSDNVFTPCTKPPPAVETQPSVKALQENDIYASIMQSSGRWTNTNWTKQFKNVTIPNFIVQREIGMKRQQQFTHGDRCVLNTKFLPNKMRTVDNYHHKKAFCGIFSKEGDVFLSACQDQNIRVYNTKNEEFKKIKTIRARDVGWSVLDTAFSVARDETNGKASPDGRYAAYSSWSDCIHLCSIDGDHDDHEALHFDPGDHSFCIFSLMFSSDNTEILGGANDGNLYVYDLDSKKRTLKIDAHDDDVNTVRFADASSQILYSGGDDGLCKVWDRRTLREERPIPVGTLAGHCDGITYIDSKGDARFFVSNSKDQTMKLWDIRCFSDQAGIEETKKVVSSQRWDYRWQQVPRRMAKKRDLKGDSSVMTYRGHCILHTLIRCKFSPEATTGQRYIYTGCATGSIVVYDLLSGKIVRKLEGHGSCVRDVSWHPYNNFIISTSWDGTLGLSYFHDYNAHNLEPDEEEITILSRFGPKRQRIKRTRETAFPGLYD